MISSARRATVTFIDDVAYAAPSASARKTAALVAIGCVALVLAVAPFANIRASYVPAFLPTFGTAAILGPALATFILSAQFRASRNAAIGFLAITFGIQTILSTAYLLCFPRTYSEHGLFGAGPQTAAWLYFSWHYSFAMLVPAYVAATRRIAANGARAGSTVGLALTAAVGTIAVASVLVATIRFSDRLTPLVDATGRVTSFGTGVVVPIELAMLVGALAFLVRTTRLRSSVDLWIGVSLLAFACEGVLSGWLGSTRFSYGWYFSRLEWMIAALSFPFVLVYQMNQLIVGLSLVNRSLEAESDTDALTEVLNRRGFDARVGASLAKATREGEPFTMLVVDVDEFKSFNDTFGHQAGDVALRSVAQSLGRSVSPNDIVGRIGGEEFAIALPNTNRRDAYAIAESARREVAALGIRQYDGGAHRHLTISVGVASTDDVVTRSALDLLTAADRALYTAKRAGRDRTHIALVQESEAAVQR